MDETIPFKQYIDQLLADLDFELQNPAAQRPLSAIFIGGGTPSLFPGWAIQDLLDGIRAYINFNPALEITLEANPGTLDLAKLAAYRAAGVNRLSLGVQSLSSKQLINLGRLHNPEQVKITVKMARKAGFDNINLDLMFALPRQDLSEAQQDLTEILELNPEHISYYQLTIAAGTEFYNHPPDLPSHDLAAEIAAQGRQSLLQAGYLHYEVSAFARQISKNFTKKININQSDNEKFNFNCCLHNINYWQFGDYLGIGAGAHGKLTMLSLNQEQLHIRRTVKQSNPRKYLNLAPQKLIQQNIILTEADCVVEFALNALRLNDGFAPELFNLTTGLPWEKIAGCFAKAQAAGLLNVSERSVCPTPLGKAFLDNLITYFLI